MDRVGRYLVILALASLLSGQAAAQSGQNPIDVRVVVDISGSMKSNDPSNLRQPAVRLLARLIPQDATAGVWTFGQYVNMLVPHGEVDPAWRNRAIDRSSDINSVALRTNLGEALEVASESYYSGGSLEHTHFILLTDGKVDVSAQAPDNERERQRILEEVLPGLEQAGATVHTVALSDNADLALLEAFADRTGGSYNFAETAEDLNRVFLRALNAAAPQDQLPIEGNRFLVDAGVQEFTALIFSGEQASAAGNTALTLVDPDGQQITPAKPGDGVRWVQEAGYDLITIVGPKPGEWRLRGELGQGSRVTVVSDLRMVVPALPPRFRPGDTVTVTAHFEESEQIITDRDFLGVIEVTLTLTDQHGRSGTKALSPEVPPDDGVYRDEITRLPEPGDYRLELVADGQTFSRKFSQVLTYILPAGDDRPVSSADTPELAESLSSEPSAQPAGESADEPSPEQPTEPAIPDGGPIDLSAVEPPQPLAPEAPDVDRDWILYYAVAGSLGALGLIGAGLWFWRRKRREDPEHQPVEEAPKAVEDVSDEPEPSGEPGEEKVPSEEEAKPAEDEAEVEQEPEAEVDSGQDQTEKETEQEQPPAEEEEDFGLEDFDLSEIEDLGDQEDEKNASADGAEADTKEQESDDEKK
ncbi:MAG: VWA domain-containing protein [Marinobacter sp.]|uniref:VWA domain-containing protein n=1 Tax=Marinobacter sp. TaxID=50741 RepID=UPI00299CFB96|nr:VWA domain-containing protein [Marinobacter sp.]MDX1754907.1 VWA domain-containing protein [Marinobacter sp.]